MSKDNFFIVMGIFLVILFDSLIYGAINSEMFINGEAHVRVDKDIRITSLKVVEQTNGAYETYNSDYSKDSTSLQVTLPSSDSMIIYEVTITNKAGTDYKVKEIIEESYSNSNIKYEIIDLEEGTVIDGGTIHTFKIKFTTTANNLDNKETLVLKYTFEEWISNLYNIVAHKSRSLDTDIDFSVVPIKETSGVYEMNSTKDDEYPVYYYRGIVDNNNVSFAGFCWKMVRTTGTGGVKLIYNGVVGEDGSCNNTGEASQIGTSAFSSNYNSAMYVKYMYNAATNSTVKNVIDKWYSENMLVYTDMLEDTVWCNDQSVSSVGSNGSFGSITNYGAVGRLTSTQIVNPSLDCPDEASKFTVDISNGNGLLTYPVALLTADEIVMAGHGYKLEFNAGYLYTGKLWWSLSPFSFNGYNSAMFRFNSSIEYGNVDHTYYGIRPSISLLYGTIVTRGDGTVFKPYHVFTS